MTAPDLTLLCASARALPLPDESVQCVVTSPPYWGLRVYEGVEPEVWGGDPEHAHEWTSAGTAEGFTGKKRWVHRSGDGHGGQEAVTRSSHPEAWGQVSQGAFCECGAWLGMLGLEPDYQMYVDHTAEWMREVHRVLRPDGVVWLNLGDCYAGSWGNYGSREGGQRAQNEGGEDWGRPGYGGAWRPPGTRQSARRDRAAVVPLTGPQNLRPKNRMMIPARVAIALQDSGDWIVRSEIVWHKPNAMPSSVKDRPTDAHEMIYLLSKSARYYYDGDAIAEPIASSSIVGSPLRAEGKKHEARRESAILAGGNSATTTTRSGNFVAGAMRSARTVWTIPTQPYPDAHFATFPEEIPRRCILAGSREGDIILDPFVGSGTAGLVALRNGRSFIGVDASAKYLAMARARIDPLAGEQEKAREASAAGDEHQTVMGL